MTHNLDLGLLRTFIHVADAGSMTVAANRLHMTQGAVSQQIKRLEDVFGRVILQRGRQGVRLTDEGERLLVKAKRLVALNDDIWADMRTPGITGQVRLGVPYDLAGTHLPGVLQTYAQRHPNVHISLVSGSSPDLVNALSSGKIDLALIEDALGSTAGERLAVEQLVWVGRHDGHAYMKRPLPICLVSETCIFRPAIFAALDSKNIEWRIVFENASIEATNATVRNDLAVTAWLASTVPHDLEILDCASGLPELPCFAINLHLPKNGASAACLAMAACIRASYLERRRAK